MIRTADLSDIARIEELALRMKRRTEQVTVKVEFERARKALRNCVSSPQGFLAVAEHDERITGVLAGITDHFWYSADRFASDLMFFSQRRGDGARLLQRFKEWADAKGATLLLGQSSGQHSSSVSRIYQGLGMVAVGSIYMGERPISVRKIRSA